MIPGNPLQTTRSPQISSACLNRRHRLCSDDGKRCHQPAGHHHHYLRLSRPQPPCPHDRNERRLVVRGSDGDFVPSYNGQSPERFASRFLEAFLTQAAARIVLKQMEGVAPRLSVQQQDAGLDGERAAARSGGNWEVLKRYLEDEPCRDAGEWMRGLMALDALLGVRVADARQSYASDENGFEWETFRVICCKNLEDDNLAMQQEMVARSFSSAPAAEQQDE